MHKLDKKCVSSWHQPVAVLRRCACYWFWPWRRRTFGAGFPWTRLGLLEPQDPTDLLGSWPQPVLGPCLLQQKRSSEHAPSCRSSRGHLGMLSTINLIVVNNEWMRVNWEFSLSDLASPYSSVPLITLALKILPVAELLPVCWPYGLGPDDPLLM